MASPRSSSSAEHVNDQSSGSGSTRCPICRAEVGPTAATAPFCGPRCKQIDLGRWFDESYTISRPIEERDLEQGE